MSVICVSFSRIFLAFPSWLQNSCHSSILTRHPPWQDGKKAQGISSDASIVFSYEGEKSFPEVIQCPVDLLLYPSYQNWNTFLFLNPSGKVGDGIIISDLTRNFSIASFFYTGTGSKHFKLCVQYMTVLYILPLLIFTTFLNVKTILSHAPVC